MKNLVILIIFTSYLVSAKVGEIKLNLNNLNFGNLQLTSNVNKDLQEIIDILPTERIEGIIRKWIVHDQDVRNNWMYITSDHFRNILFGVQNSDEFLAVQEKLASANIDLPFFTQQMHDKLAQIRTMTHSDISNNVPEKRVNGLRLMLNEIRPEIPISKIIFKGANKFVHSPKFRDFVAIIRSTEFRALITELGHSLQVRNMISDMKANGIDIQAISDFIYSLSPLLEQHLHGIVN